MQTLNSNIKLQTRQPKPRRLVRSVFTLFTLIVMLGLIGVGAAALWYQDATTQPVGGSAETKTFEVPEGKGLIEIAPDLQAAGLLKNADALRIYLRLNNPVIDLKPGKYAIAQNVNIAGLIETLNKGPQKVSVSVTLQEGTRFDEIATKLTAAFKDFPEAQFKESEFLQIAANPSAAGFSTAVANLIDKYKPAGKSLEGFVFADTYNLGLDADAKSVMELLITTHFRELVERDVNPDQVTRLKNYYEVVTLASIVEREANNLVDKKIVADIFLRRLARREVLGADAPLLYLKKDWTRSLTLAEINDASNLYNTRARLGLPPTPICNPSMNAIVAVMNPTPNNYNYFISDGNGKNYYATTYAQHLDNIRRYL